MILPSEPPGYDITYIVKSKKKKDQQQKTENKLMNTKKKEEADSQIQKRNYWLPVWRVREVQCMGGGLRGTNC